LPGRDNTAFRHAVILLSVFCLCSWKWLAKLQLPTGKVQLSTITNQQIHTELIIMLLVILQYDYDVLESMR